MLASHFANAHFAHETQRKKKNPIHTVPLTAPVFTSLFVFFRRQNTSASERPQRPEHKADPQRHKAITRMEEEEKRGKKEKKQGRKIRGKRSQEMWNKRNGEKVKSYPILVKTHTRILANFDLNINFDWMFETLCSISILLRSRGASTPCHS